MEKCCIKGCESFKYAGTGELSYFNFPIHDETLMKKWLNQIQLPNWKPKHHQICSLHFAEEDVDRRPNRRQPYLKLTSVPTIFPSQERKSLPDTVHYLVMPDSQPLQSTAQTFSVGINGNFNTPVLQQGSLILIPTGYSIANPTQIYAPLNLNEQTPIHDQLQQIIRIPNPSYMNIDDSPVNDESQKLPISPPKLRKILPKSITPYPTNQASPISPPEDICTPEILIVPKARGTSDSNGLNFQTGYSDNKVPTLKITIHKLCDASSESKETAAIPKKPDNCTPKENPSRNEDTLEKEITIENSLTKKSVTFRLDPKTGEIIVGPQDIDGSSMDHDSSHSERIKRKVDTFIRPSCKKLHQLREKEGRDCAKFRKSMRLLRQCHKREEEEEEIENLQNHLHGVDDRIDGNGGSDVTMISRITTNDENTNGIGKSMEGNSENSTNETRKGDSVQGLMNDSSSIENYQQSRLSSLRTRRNNGDCKFQVNEGPKKTRFEVEMKDKIEDKRIDQNISFHDSESDDFTYQYEFVDQAFS